MHIMANLFWSPVRWEPAVLSLSDKEIRTRCRPPAMGKPGRKLSRGDSIKGHDAEFTEFLKSFRVVTAVDLKSHQLRMRPDIVSRKLEEIKQEAPHAYKGIGPIVGNPDERRGFSSKPVAELRPLMTVKG